MMICRNSHRTVKLSSACFWLCLSLVALFQNTAAAADVDFSEDYERIFQIRVVSTEAGGKSSIGSGFQVSADGLIITNYHVVSEFINAPEQYNIQFASQDNEQGPLQLVDFDVVSDLALLRHPDAGEKHFSFNNKPITKGEVAYALGNPGDWGIVMVPGPNNGLVEHSYEDRILFSGSLNPGMSGGPSLNRHGEVVGINVATAGSQLSFLVPARKAVELLHGRRELIEASYQDEITQQIKAWQAQRIQSLIDEPWATEDFKGRPLFSVIRKDFQCWGSTNEDNEFRHTARVSRQCSAGDDVYVDSDLNLGHIYFSYSQYQPINLNDFQFANSRGVHLKGRNRTAYEHSTNFQCDTDFVEGSNGSPEGFFRVITCVRAYKQLHGLYDSVILVQHNQTRQAFSAMLSLSGVEKGQIKALNRRFVEQSL